MADDQQRPPYGPPQPQFGQQPPPPGQQGPPQWANSPQAPPPGQQQPPHWGNPGQAPPPWQQGQPPQQQGEPPRRRRWWLWAGIAVVVVALVAVFVVRFTKASQLQAGPPATPPTVGSSAPAATTPSAPKDPGVPTRCPQEPAGFADCFPVSISALRSALTAQGYHCAPEDGVPTNITCDKPARPVSYTVQFGKQNGGVGTILYSGTVGAYVNSMTKTQDDAFDNSVQAMNTMLAIVFPHSPSLRSTLADWMRSQRETLKTRSADTSLAQGYDVGCTDGSPVDVAGAQGTFRTWTFPCTMRIAPN